jgi:hypothetical protein
MRPLLKTAERSATVSFCQNGPYLAAGSVAGAIDLSFSTSSQLEVRLPARALSWSSMIAGIDSPLPPADLFS